VSVRVSPLQRRFYAGWHTGPFTILDFPDIPPLGALAPRVYTSPGGPAVVKAADLGGYTTVFDDMCRHALDEQSSHTLLARMVKRFGGVGG
jgi:hypothetical protein